MALTQIPRYVTPAKVSIAKAMQKTKPPASALAKALGKKQQFKGVDPGQGF